MRSRPISLCVLPFLFMASLGCNEPIEPGSDLEDPAPMAEIGSFEDYELEGVFGLTGSFGTGAGMDRLPFTPLTLLTWEKRGDIVQANAELDTVVSYPFDQTETMGPTQEGSPISAAGNVKVVLAGFYLLGPPQPPPPDMDMDASMSGDMASAPVIQGVLTLDARIRSENCVDGTASLLTDLSPFPLTTTFVATKQGESVDVMKLDDVNVACKTSVDGGGAQ